MTVKILRFEQFIPRPLDEVFPFFSKPENLDKITPPELGFKILTPSPIPMAEGVLIDYVIRLYGIPMQWRTLIQKYDPPHSFTDIQVKGPYETWIHTHRFKSCEGGTFMEDEVELAVPFWFFGDVVRKLFVERQVRKIFTHRKKVIETIFSENQK